MKICALVPAYNEEKTVAEVIYTLTGEKLIDKIVVVDDGSEDRTAVVAREAGARVISLPENQGKGAAILKGLQSVEADIILMLDADLIGLTGEHIRKLLQPLIDDRADMAVGVFNEGRGLTDLAQFFTPNLSGQRAIKADVLAEINDLDKEGFGIELTLNKYVKDNGRLEFVNLPELTHVMKEEKMGLIKGVKARLAMYWDIVKTIFFRIIRKQDHRDK